MPILKREPDQYPPDLLTTERSSLELAQSMLTTKGAMELGSESEPQGENISSSGDAGEASTTTTATSTTATSTPVGTEAVLANQLGSFGYYTSYFGSEVPRKPLTFWAGDWEDFAQYDPEAAGWWCLYTHSRQEKVLMRHLYNRRVSFYCPLVEKRSRSPQGRMRSSYLPLFTNYVFLKGTDEDRRLALATNCVLAAKPIRQPDYLVHDLWQISVAVSSGVPITAEQKLEQGDPVMVKSGPFKGFEGFIIRRAGTTRFLIFLRYLEQGVSMEIDEGALVAV